MNTIITNFESAFFHLASFASFDHFIALILFGIVFQLKDWKLYFTLLLSITIGSIAGLLLCSLKVVSLSISTIKLLLACSILLVSINNLFSNNGSSSAIRFNSLALVGIAMGIGLYGHLSQRTGSSFSFLPFLGYNLGVIAAYFVISFAALLFAALTLLVFKTERKSFNLVISGIGVGISLVLIFLRY